MKVKQIEIKKEYFPILFTDTCKEIMETILGESKDYYGVAFAYLFRRFGATINACDDYKELTKYTLQTHQKGWIMNIAFNTGSISYSLYSDNKSIKQEFHRERWQVSKRYYQEVDVWLALNGMTRYDMAVEKEHDPEGWEKINHIYGVWQEENGYATKENKSGEEISQMMKLFLRYIDAENKRVIALCPVEQRDESEFQFPIRDKAHAIVTKMAKDFLIPTSIRDTYLNILGKFDEKKVKKCHEYFEHAGEPYSVKLKM